jgi:hypothetical protein
MHNPRHFEEANMGTSDLNATVEIKSGLQKDPGAWAQAATLRLDESGFRDPEGLGRAGAEPGIIDISRVTQMLLSTFDRDDLCAVLDHLVRLREALKP